MSTHPEELGPGPDRWAFECSEGGELRSLDYDSAVARLSAGDGLFWIHVNRAGEEDVHSELRRMGIDEVTIPSLLEGSSSVGVRSVSAGFALEFPLSFVHGPARIATMRALALDRALLTFAPKSADCSGLGLDSPNALPRAAAASSLGILASALGQLSVEFRRATLDLRDSGTMISRKIGLQPGPEDGDTIARAKLTAIDLDAIVEERIPVLQSLLTSKAVLGGDPLVRDELEMALTVSESTERRLERIDRRLSEQQARLDVHMQERINRRLSRLTVLSAVFLPMSLIAGIYGMNFERMPELAQPYGYPAVLGTMVAIAIGSLLWFRRSGWLE